MKKSVWIWAGVLILLISGAVYITNQYSMSEPSVAIALPPTPEENNTEESSLIDFTLSDLDGNPVALEDFRGKYVFVNFWATWCKWCVKEMPDMELVRQAYEDQDVVILAIAVGEERDVVYDYLQDKDYKFGILLDPDKSVTKSFGVKSIPTSIFIDKEGNASYMRVGAMNEEQMREAIEQLYASAD